MSKLLGVFILIFSPIVTQAAVIQKYNLPKNLVMINLWSGPAMGPAEWLYDLTVDLAHKKITGKFETYKPFEGDWGDEEADPVVLKQCHFNSKLTIAELQKIKSLIGKVTYCKRRSDSGEIADYSSWDSFTAYWVAPSEGNDGRYLTIDEFFEGSDGVHRYFCGGGQNLYDYLKTITMSRAPASCPAQYTDLFKIN